MLFEQGYKGQGLIPPDATGGPECQAMYSACVRSSAVCSETPKQNSKNDMDFTVPSITHSLIGRKGVRAEIFYLTSL